MRTKKALLSLSTLALLTAAPSYAEPKGVLPQVSYAKNTFSPVYDDGKLFGQVKYRYEYVNQDNALNEANANTVRFNLGYQTGVYKGFSGLIEGQVIQHFAAEDFNSLDNNRTRYSVVADPNTVELNRILLAYTGLPDTTIKFGRQFFNLDNQRFIGTVDWRQNDQTFDALSITNSSIENLNLQYAQIEKVNRIFEGSAPADDLESQTHVFRAGYKHADWLNAAAYGYLMEFDNAKALSNKTFGLRAIGKFSLGKKLSATYEAEFAKQSDYGDSPLNYDENYYHIAPKISGYGLTLGGGYEVLKGDGTNAFQTPLATLHKFNGWADVFLNTPANGLEDRYALAAYKVNNTETLLDGIKFTAIYHDYKGDEAGDFGNELNLLATKAITLPDMFADKGLKTVNVLLKYADYQADDAPYVDTQKFWLQLGVKF